ncbi:MAG: outer membrane lipoprotein chaperone LolA [Gammaproteobacteria bacterium]|nr:outer membrane lipoprotein chaperone LolA [Gammaproteobacteria bacterium]
MTNIVRGLTSLLLWSLLSVACAADAATTSLDRFFSGLRNLTANFDQTITDAKGVVTQNASGKVTIQRPGKFRWDYVTPYEQLVLGDGQHLWTYDADLEQATVKPQSDALAGTPALLLSAKEQPGDLFDIAPLPARESEEWFELTPKSQNGLGDTQFNRLRLGFVHDTLVAMELVDAFDQTTLIRFNDLQRNGGVSAALFDFTPPAGVDVIGDMP